MRVEETEFEKKIEDFVHTQKEERNNKKNDSQKVYYANQPKIGRQGPSKLWQSFSTGLTSFLVIAAGIAFYFALLRLTNLSDVFGNIIGVLKPVLYGCVIAFLLNPIVKKVDKYLLPLLEKKMKKKETAAKVSRGVGIFLSEVLLVVLIVELCNMLIPELYSSIKNLVYTLPRQLNAWVSNLNDVMQSDSTLSNVFKEVLSQGTEMLQNWLRTDLLSRTNEMMGNLTEGVMNVLSELFNAIIGMIVSIYLLFSKELFASQMKKCVYAVFPPRYANLLLHLTTKTNEIFGGFIIAKIIDSAIIGVLCFIGLSILNIPYTLLVSVVVGITNVIPFFGPYIGAIPSAILIMLADPMKGLYFIIFILILQQFDGNIIGPKILGNSTGLSAFWVIVAILLGGGLFGFVGMVMGVPTFAVVYYIVGMIMEGQLEKKKLPTESRYYDEMSYVDDQGIYVHSETGNIYSERENTHHETEKTYSEPENTHHEMEKTEEMHSEHESSDLEIDEKKTSSKDEMENSQDDNNMIDNGKEE
jgi:predicted PurR-regulated permease PerM